jgi:hypothetical protein
VAATEGEIVSKSDIRRCGWIPDECGRALNGQEMSNGDRLAMIDRHGCHVVAAWRFGVPTGCSFAACDAHLGCMLSGYRKILGWDATSIWPASVKDPKLPLSEELDAAMEENEILMETIHDYRNGTVANVGRTVDDPDRWLAALDARLAKVNTTK